MTMSSCLLLRGAASSLISLAVRSLGSSSSVLQDRLFTSRVLPFSTSSADDCITRIESSVGKIVTSTPFRVETIHVDVPIPDGFPFTVEGLKFERRNKDEKVEVNLAADYKQLINGIPCTDMSILIWRGHWRIELKAIVGPNTLSIQKAAMSVEPNHRLRCFDEFLDSKGINARMISSLFHHVGKEIYA